ncbi:hypothetical protein SAMN05518672_1011040 [Chitinophaga sp. CF118]|nr:hypothetical protein SAMN05518672_1011040 [Chitinophaga sp. CF118]
MDESTMIYNFYRNTDSGIPQSIIAELLHYLRILNIIFIYFQINMITIMLPYTHMCNFQCLAAYE